jgi:hypothetical protein
MPMLLSVGSAGAFAIGRVAVEEEARASVAADDTCSFRKDYQIDLDRFRQSDDPVR